MGSAGSLWACVEEEETVALPAPHARAPDLGAYLQGPRRLDVVSLVAYSSSVDPIAETQAENFPCWLLS